MYEFNEKNLDEKDTMTFVRKIKEKFIDNEYPNKILLCNHIKYAVKVFSIGELKQLNINKKEEIYFYHERLEKLYKTNLYHIYEYVEQLEPWEDIDCLITNETYNWLVAITHSDEILTVGIDKE